MVDHLTVAMTDLGSNSTGSQDFYLNLVAALFNAKICLFKKQVKGIGKLISVRHISKGMLVCYQRSEIQQVQFLKKDVATLVLI